MKLGTTNLKHGVILVREGGVYYMESWIRMGSPSQCDSTCRARDARKGICDTTILHFSYYCKYGVLFFGDDGTVPADESKRTKRV